MEWFGVFIRFFFFLVYSWLNTLECDFSLKNIDKLQGLKNVKNVYRVYTSEKTNKELTPEVLTGTTHYFVLIIYYIYLEIQY